MKTPQRRKRFEEKCQYYIKDGEPATLINGNDTGWNGDMAGIA
jgi:hypothetical protein